MNGWLRCKGINLLPLLMLLQLMSIRHPWCMVQLLSGTRIIINYHLSAIYNFIMWQVSPLIKSLQSIKSLILKQRSLRNKFINCGSLMLIQGLSFREKKVLKGKKGGQKERLGSGIRVIVYDKGCLSCKQTTQVWSLTLNIVSWALIRGSWVESQE